MTDNKFFPNLYIIGVYKSGTTSLHNYLVKHPLIDQGIHKETHYLDKYVYEELNSNRISPEGYSAKFKKSSGKYLLDSSPSYLYGTKELIDFIKCNSSSPKIILLLRNPKDRFISYYRYLHSKGIIKDNFQNFVEKCRNNHDSKEQLRLGVYSNALKEGLYLKYLKKWINEFPENLIVLFSEDLKVQPQHEMNKVFSFLSLEPLVYSNQDLTLSNMTINPRSTIIHNLLSSINFRKIIRPKMYNILIKLYRKINNQKEISITNKETIFLDNFYKADNYKLFDYLQIKQRW